MERTPTSHAAEWHTCCSKSSTGFVKFITQAFLAAGMMGVCMAQLSKESTVNKELYWGALCSILFTFMPHPTLSGPKALTPEDLSLEFQKVHITPRSPQRRLQRPGTLQDPSESTPDS